MNGKQRPKAKKLFVLKEWSESFTAGDTADIFTRPWSMSVSRASPSWSDKNLVLHCILKSWLAVFKLFGKSSLHFTPTELHNMRLLQLTGCRVTAGLHGTGWGWKEHRWRKQTGWKRIWSNPTDGGCHFALISDLPCMHLDPGVNRLGLNITSVHQTDRRPVTPDKVFPICVILWPQEEGLKNSKTKRSIHFTGTLAHTPTHRHIQDQRSQC